MSDTIGRIEFNPLPVSGNIGWVKLNDTNVAPEATPYPGLSNIPEPPKKQLPTIEEIGGSDPDFTGGLTAEAYIAQMRGRPDPPEVAFVAACLAYRERIECDDLDNEVHLVYPPDYDGDTDDFDADCSPECPVREACDARDGGWCAVWAVADAHKAWQEAHRGDH